MQAGGVDQEHVAARHREPVSEHRTGGRAARERVAAHDEDRLEIVRACVRVAA